MRKDGALGGYVVKMQHRQVQPTSERLPNTSEFGGSSPLG